MKKFTNYCNLKMGGKQTIQANTADVDPDLMANYPDQIFIKTLVNKTHHVDAHIKVNTPYNFISSSLAFELGLNVDITNRGVTSLSEEVTKYSRECNADLTVVHGGLKMDGVEFLLLDSHEPDTPMMTLGFEFFRNFKYISLVYSGDFPIATMYGPCSVPLEKIVKINGIIIKHAHIYSDHSQSMVSMEFAKRMVLPLFREKSSSTVNSASPYTSDIYTLVNLSGGTAGGLKHENFKFVVVEDLPIKVLLGTDFLQKHQEVKIEYEGELPRLKVEIVPRES